MGCSQILSFRGHLVLIEIIWRKPWFLWLSREVDVSPTLPNIPCRALFYTHHENLGGLATFLPSLKFMFPSFVKDIVHGLVLFCLLYHLKFINWMNL